MDPGRLLRLTAVRSGVLLALDVGASAGAVGLVDSTGDAIGLFLLLVVAVGGIAMVWSVVDVAVRGIRTAAAVWALTAVGAGAGAAVLQAGVVEGDWHTLPEQLRDWGGFLAAVIVLGALPGGMLTAGVRWLDEGRRPGRRG